MKNKVNQFLNEDGLIIESGSHNFKLNVSNKFMLSVAIPPTILLIAVAILNVL